MKSDKDLYRQLRGLSPEQLWSEEVPRFDRAPPRERIQRVAVIRAVGVVFSGSGDLEQKARVRAWLQGLLDDPQEKIRRYALAALPKVGAGRAAERAAIELLKEGRPGPERKSAGQVLDKIGGATALEAGAPLPSSTEQKIRARIAREEQPGSLRMDAPVPRIEGLRIHLRCRRGLESFVRDEVLSHINARSPFRLLDVRPGRVALAPAAPFTLADLYRMRCFATVGFTFALTTRDDAKALAALLTSPASRQLLAALTEGTPRYRLDFVGKGHQRGNVRGVANLAYARSPELLNDPRRAPWSADVYDTPHGASLEWRPRVNPDPRLFYRTDDVDASSHPPLAACMARLAGALEDAVVWDPFCGAGLELVECALRGGVRHLFGTDASAAAVAIAKANLAASHVATTATFAACDFRAYATVPGLGAGRVALIITNPPMGRRIRLPDPAAFFADFFAAASDALAPGGQLIFPNPLRLEPRDDSLKLEFRQAVDLGGFTCRLERWRKLHPSAIPAVPPARVAATARPKPRAQAPWYASVARRRPGQARR